MHLLNAAAATIAALCLVTGPAGAQTAPVQPKSILTSATINQMIADTAAAKTGLSALLAGTSPATGLRVAGVQSIPTCPVSNCPTTPGSGYGGNGGGPTLSSHWLYGSTVAGRDVSEFMLNIGLYVGTGAGNGQKVGQYTGVMQGPGAGTAWAGNTDIVRGACPGGANSLYGMPGSGIPFGTPGCTAQPGSLGSQNSTINWEFDTSNFDADTKVSGAFVVGLYVSTLSTYTSTAGISFGNGGSVASWHHGIEFAPNVADDVAIYDLSGAKFGYFTSAAHGLATYHDEGGGPVSIELAGTKTVADIKSISSSPAIMSLQGAHSIAALYDFSTGPAGFKVDATHTSAHLLLGGQAPAAVSATGTFSLAAFTSVTATASIAYQAAAGQQVCWAGISACISYNSTNHRYYVTDGLGAIVASIADGGNMILKGTLTQSGTP